ncbi:PAS domain-containing protein [Amycolatopsis cihanbeyliensis]|uniref:PAS domain S-box-containing protein n=1 Tax=Amycolatopsis cihanbeyliensis TaxID=1128664 RepID=A0A542CS49_AMYCI|nr:PAS domain-containing protein [Amycolatopsis cihanbeyliensis]TQI93658.1 PAS domain S-box-containing protein [Amycolatopsis cihanbeyliensis]
MSVAVENAPRTTECGEAWRPESGRDVFRSFIERSGIGFARLDRGTRVVRANPDFARQFGRSPGDVHGRELCELLHPDARDRVGMRLAALAGDTGGRFTERSVAMRRGTAELTGVAVPDRSGRFEGVLVLVEPESRETDTRQAAGRRQLLSEVDARIIEGIGAGVSTVQLAARLYLSRGGIEYHVTNLLRRFKVKNRPALISKAYSMGVFRAGSWPPRVLPDFVK